MSNNRQCIEQPIEGAATIFDIEVSQTIGERTFSMKEQGFAITWQGQTRAYLNHCPHAGSPLDWIPGRFFSEDGNELVCHTHNARFAPDSGECLAGPCPRGLYMIPLNEADGKIELPTTFELG